jgi:hypothetical protein
MTTIAWINTQTNVCDNVSLDDRPASEITAPGYLMLDLDVIGGGGIGDIWDGSKLNPPEPVTPPEDQPTTEGTQEL